MRGSDLSRSRSAALVLAPSLRPGPTTHRPRPGPARRPSLQPAPLPQSPVRRDPTKALAVSETKAETCFCSSPAACVGITPTHPARSFCSTANTPGSIPKATPRCSASEPNNSTICALPLRFLLGHTQLEKEIDHLAVSPAANGSFTLTGIPHGQEKRIQRLALTVTADGTITAIEIQETDGAQTRFTFTGEQVNAPIPQATFNSPRPPECP